MGDAELTARLARGDRAAFDAIFRAWYEPLVRTADAVVRDRAVAEDLAQDVLLELWRRRESLALEEGPGPWLVRSARNRALNHLRNLRTRERLAHHVHGDEAEAARGAAGVVAEELAAAARAAVASLPPRCREVFELSRVHGLRYAEIAETLGVSVKAVEAQMGRALRVMRERLAAWLPGGDEL